MDWTPDELQKIVDEHPLVLFMKGTPTDAQCGFSSRAAQVLQAMGEPFASVNVLSDPRAIPSICAWSDFPTMPQIFINGELIGGSDIALEMYESGELQKMISESSTEWDESNVGLRRPKKYVYCTIWLYINFFCTTSVSVFRN